jgi:hypothetical protein
MDVGEERSKKLRMLGYCRRRKNFQMLTLLGNEGRGGEK